MLNDARKNIYIRSNWVVLLQYYVNTPSLLFLFDIVYVRYVQVWRLQTITIIYIVCLWRLRKKYDNIGCDTCVDFRVNRVEIYMLILAENEGNRPRSPLQNKPSGRVLNSSWNTRALFSFIDIESAATSTWSIQYNLNAFFSMIFWCVFGETFLQGFKEANTREKTFQHSGRSGGWGNFGTLAVNSHAKFGGN